MNLLYKCISHHNKMANITETTWSWNKIFSGNLIQYIYITKMDLSQNSQKSHLVRFPVMVTHVHI